MGLGVGREEKSLRTESKGPPPVRDQEEAEDPAKESGSLYSLKWKYSRSPCLLRVFVIRASAYCVD